MMAEGSQRLPARLYTCSTELVDDISASVDRSSAGGWVEPVTWLVSVQQERTGKH